MAMPSLFEDCQAWIDKGQESWKSYFSKWETFAKYEEETLTESELIKPNGKCEEERDGNKKMQNLLLFQKKQKVALFKNRQSGQKKHNKSRKIYKNTKAEVKKQRLYESLGNKSLSETIENEQLEITLTTVFSDLLKANTNIKDMFAVFFQTFAGGEMTIKDSNYSFPEQQVSPHGGFEMNVASPSFENQQVLLLPIPKSGLNDRSICPDRNVYLQSLNKNIKEIHSKQIQSLWWQWESPRIGAENTTGFGLCNSTKHQFLTSSGSQTPLLGQNPEVRNCPPLEPVTFRLRNTGLKSVQFDTSQKFPSNFCQNKDYLRHISISKMNITQEGKRIGNLCLQQKTNSLSLRRDNTNCMILQRKLSEQKCLNKMPSQRRHPSKKLMSGGREDDSDSDDQTEYHSPLIHCQNKRQRAGELIVDAAEPDTDDCRYIFDRIMKS